ncbi:hypothetical protein [Clostridium felsineum]|uniref:hypothetical protein n=1 Tax=Clostridium felsineum TaxID=36839 RepID=UPI00098C5A30|nr:hypothetical protein [Clostridium felsineum]URZ02165.1 hypothetical protein CLAUR_021620 [Clostridium felsineum]
MDDEFEYIKSLKTDELIEIIKNIWGFEETSAAIFELMDRDENRAVELGIVIIEDDKGDDYLQATVFDFIYDLNPKATIDSLYRRKTDIGPILLGDVMSSIAIEYYKEKQPEFLEGLTKHLLKRYIQLNEYEKERILENYKEFKEALKDKSKFDIKNFIDNN